MKLRIAGWKSEGLRCPDLSIELTHKKGTVGSGSVHLIQMPNGTGKTTTLELMRACMTGSAKNWARDQIVQFHPDESNATGSGFFEIDLEFDEKPISIRLTFDFDEGSAIYRTTSTAMGGVVMDWRLPPSLHQFLTPQFIKLLVFDGEFAADLLSPGKTNADEALNAMCQLHLLDAIRSFARTERDEKVKAAGRGPRATKGRSLENNEAEQREVNKKIAQLEKKRVAFNEKQSELAKQIAKHEKDIEDIFERDGPEDAVSAARNKEDASAIMQAQRLDDLWRSFKNPFSVSTSIASRITSFRKQLDTVKLPDATSRQFFVELADEGDCVCGRPIGEAEKQHILSHSEKFLGEREAGVLNALKLDVDQASAGAEINGLLASDQAELLGNAMEALDVARSERVYVEQSRAGAEKDKYVRLNDELEGFRAKARELKGALDELERPAKRAEGPESICIDYQKKRLRDLEIEGEVLTGTVDIGERTRILEEILDAARASTRESVRAQLVESGNERLRQILRNSPIQMADVVPHITLLAQRGASVGQKLAVGYVFLTGLIGRKAHSLPLVVDSPAAGIDNTVGREIGQMLPKLCDQFVTFVISRERPGFVDELERTAGSVQYLTIFRKLPATRHFLDKAPKTRVETDRAVLVEDRSFFMSFDTEASAE